MKKHTNVFRIDIEPSDAHPKRHPTHGWQVRVRRQGQQHTKFFSDSRHGDADTALGKALVYRDTLIEELPEPDDPVARSAEARSRTGVVGLNFCQKNDGSGKTKPYVQLSWLTPKGRRRGASYSVEKWGLDEALWHACCRLHDARADLDDQQPSPRAMYRTAYVNIARELGQPVERHEVPAPPTNGHASTNGHTRGRRHVHAKEHANGHASVS